MNKSRWVRGAGCMTCRQKKRKEKKRKKKKNPRGATSTASK
ncbi:predicted protein [Plenodomus lingam JN3]|uniref:Predicted protein n=1 Tax=Leptosphaeria maculans (strain JN3 / isolate v23.1.3 / race Av1-4-5-6-7-8) TaxID=985895 RepID=E4ZZ27_LEPMJ|nr:predicted protein [Plenodomus lingam JN3]CBX96462.1 predicted protein [Plenodomus lingam JN3]